MTKVLKGNEFIEEKFYEEYTSGAKEALEVTKEIKKILSKELTTKKASINLIQPDSVANLNKFNTEVKETKKVIDQLTKVEQKELQLQKDISKLKNDPVYRKQALEIERLRQEKQAINKTTREQVKDERAVKNEYERQSRLLNSLRKQYKNVALEKGENSKQARNLLAQITPLDKKLKQVDATVGQSQRNVGNYASAFRNLASSIGLTLGVAGVFRVLRSSIGVVRDFEKQSATLAGVLGKTRGEIQGLDEDAKRLGATTEFTAGEVGSLQEAYARLGLTQSQILKVTESTLRGATALQSDLGETASLVGSTLNQFGLDASKSADVVDVLARSTQISALNFQQLQTALPIVGKTADVAGVSLTETASLLGVLASNGIDASTSSTALRNIFLELSKNGLTLEEAFTKINNSQNKLNTANELFGKRGATVALTLAENTEKTNEYNRSLLLAGGTAEQLAKTQLNTLDGSLKLLNSAWEGYILELNDATNGGNILSKGVKFLADNLDTLLGVLGGLTTAFISYVAIKKTLSIVENAYNNIIKVSIFLQRTFNNVLKANPIVFLLGAFTSFVAVLGVVNSSLFKVNSSLTKFKKQTFDSEKATSRLSKAISSETAEMNSLFEILKDTNSSTEVRNKAYTELNKNYKDYLPNLIDEKTSLEDIAFFQEEANKALIKSIVLKQKQEEITRATSIRIENEQKALKKFNDAVKDGGGNLSVANQILKENIDLVKEGLREDLFGKLGNDYGLYAIQADQATGETSFFNEQLKFLQEDAKKAGVSTSELSEAISSSISSYTDSQNSIADINELYKEYIDVFAKSNIVTNNNNKVLRDNTKSKKENNKVTRESFELIDTSLEKREDEVKSIKELTFFQKLLGKTIGDIGEEVANDEEIAEKKRLENRKKGIQALNNVADAFAERERERSNERLSDIDNEIQASQNRENALLQIAESGNLNAQQSLAVEQKRQAEARLEKEKEIQKQKRIEASYALLKTYTSSLENGATPQVALTEVLNNGNLLAGLINALPTFYEGTENTTGGNLDNKGGFLSVLHPNERVVPEKFNKYLDGIPNSQLPKLAELAKNQVTVNNSWESNAQVIKKFDELKNEIKNISIPKVSYDYNNIEGTVSKIVKSKNSTLTTRKRSSIFD